MMIMNRTGGVSVCHVTIGGSTLDVCFAFLVSLIKMGGVEGVGLNN